MSKHNRQSKAAGEAALDSRRRSVSSPSGSARQREIASAAVSLLNSRRGEPPRPPRPSKDDMKSKEDVKGSIDDEITQLALRHQHPPPSPTDFPPVQSSSSNSAGGRSQPRVTSSRGERFLPMLDIQEATVTELHVSPSGSQSARPSVPQRSSSRVLHRQSTISTFAPRVSPSLSVNIVIGGYSLYLVASLFIVMDGYSSFLIVSNRY